MLLCNAYPVQAFFKSFKDLKSGELNELTSGDLCSIAVSVLSIKGMLATFVSSFEAVFIFYYIIGINKNKRTT